MANSCSFTRYRIIVVGPPSTVNPLVEISFRKHPLFYCAPFDTSKHCQISYYLLSPTSAPKSTLILSLFYLFPRSGVHYFPHPVATTLTCFFSPLLKTRRLLLKSLPRLLHSFRPSTFILSLSCFHKRSVSFTLPFSLSLSRKPFVLYKRP